MRDYQEIIKPLLTQHRYQHSLAVAEQAVQLARRWGADPNQAYEAGILHDTCKDMPKKVLLQRIEKSDILWDDIERSNPSMWHAVAGSLYVEQELGITDRSVLNAIRYHTSGRPAMTLLEQIIYLADLTSSDRDYPDVELMRQYIEESLDKATREALCFIVGDLAKQQHEICLNTYRAYNYYCLK